MDGVTDNGPEGSINPVTDLAVEGDIAVLTINSPPVNALSAKVREGIATASGRRSPTLPSRRSC